MKYDLRRSCIEYWIHRNFIKYTHDTLAITFCHESTWKKKESLKITRNQRPAYIENWKLMMRNFKL